MNIKKIIPILEWLPNYNSSRFKGDLIAGVTVGIILIPQGIAYALIAGLPPIYGLYCALLPQIMYAIFGSSSMVFHHRLRRRRRHRRRRSVIAVEPQLDLCCAGRASAAFNGFGEQSVFLCGGAAFEEVDGTAAAAELELGWGMFRYGDRCNLSCRPNHNKAIKMRTDPAE